MRLAGRLKKAQTRGGDGLVPGSWGENRKTRGRGRPRSFLELALREAAKKQIHLAAFRLAVTHSLKRRVYLHE
jgi:hypothetical protein